MLKRCDKCNRPLPNYGGKGPADCAGIYGALRRRPGRGRPGDVLGGAEATWEELARRCPVRAARRTGGPRHETRRPPSATKGGGNDAV